MEDKPMIDRDRVRQALTGPVASVPTPFLRDGSIDFAGLRRFVDFVIAAGTKSLILTFGDSLLTLLGDSEIAEVTRATVEASAGRALVIAADRSWATPQAVAFAHQARQIGADVLMILPPDWASSCEPATFVEHYAAVAQEMPVMLITALFARRPLGQSLQIIERVRDQVEGVVAIKDDVVGEFARRLGLLVYEKWAVISGGQKQNHLNAWPYGCDGYFSTFIKFRPQIAWEYWRAIQAKDLATAVRIIRDCDNPFFDFIIGMPGSFDAAMHGVLELHGIAGRWRRKPYYSLSDAEMEKLAGFMKERKWL